MMRNPEPDKGRDFRQSTRCALPGGPRRRRAPLRGFLRASLPYALLTVAAFGGVGAGAPPSGGAPVLRRHTPPQEDAGKDARALLDRKRRLKFYGRLLREASESPLVEVEWDIEEVRRALRFLAVHGTGAGPKVSAAVAKVFARTGDEEARRLCLMSLYRIDDRRAKGELLRISRDPQTDARWRALGMELLRLAVGEGQRISAPDLKALSAAPAAGGK